MKTIGKVLQQWKREKNIQRLIDINNKARQLHVSRAKTQAHAEAEVRRAK